MSPSGVSETTKKIPLIQSQQIAIAQPMQKTFSMESATAKVLAGFDK